MLFGTVPPPLKVAQGQVRSIASKVAEIIKGLKPDGVVVYDIQDEPSRSGEPRPFPFFRTHPPRMYAGIMRELTCIEPLVFRALLPGESKQDFINWVNETTSPPYSMLNFSIVGGCPEEGKDLLCVAEASAILQQQVRGSVIGGITIPERHRDKQDEPLRVYQKTLQGVSFFTSQVIYNADNVIWFLQDYASFCEEKKVKPVRLVFTFAPFSSARTVKFMEWLGIEIPLGTKKRVLSRPTSTSRAAESINICVALARRVLNACARLGLEIPLGFSVESVSKSSLEGRAAAVLYKYLEELLLQYYNRENVMARMLAEDGTYVVQTQGGGVTVTRLGGDAGVVPFAQVPRLLQRTYTLRATIAALGGEKPKKKKRRKASKQASKQPSKQDSKEPSKQPPKQPTKQPPKQPTKQPSEAAEQAPTEVSTQSASAAADSSNQSAPP